MLKALHTVATAARVLGAATVALVPIALSAQDIDVAALRELDDDRSDVRYENFTIDEIEDMNLVRDGEVIGEVEAVLAGADGEVAALAVEYRDDGPGDRDIVVPIEDVEFAADRREVHTTLSDEELAALPTWDD